MRSLIDALEKRDMATCDIPNAFMHPDMKGKVHMKSEGVMSEIIVKTDSNLYEKYVCFENGKPVIYVILEKTLYGALQAALFFWKNFSSKLKNGVLR